MKWYFIAALIYISFMAYDVEHLLMLLSDHLNVFSG